jgi:hypothetical protein
MTNVDPSEELIQVAERQLADADEAYRRDPSDANQHRIMKLGQSCAERGTLEKRGSLESLLHQRVTAARSV